ncbi:MAG TPA: peptide ABC transporter substrate-binding protein [Gemmatimonadales bacterium]
MARLMQRRFRYLAIALLAVALLAVGCTSGPGTGGTDQGSGQAGGGTGTSGADGGASSAGGEKVFRYNFTRDYGGARLDIAKGFTVLGPNLFAGLTRVDPDNQVIPGAAEDWTTSEDGKVYTFHLRDDLSWSDGTPVTAHDFEFGWKRALDPETQSVRAWMLYLIEGAQAYNEGTGDRDGVQVRALDDRTLEVTLRQPAAYFPAFIAANNVFFAQPKHVIEEHGADWVNPENIVFSGPFTVTEYVPNSVVVMERNPGWAPSLQQPAVDRVEFHIVPEASTALAMYQAGELDFALGVPVAEVPNLREDPEYGDHYALMPEFRVATLEFAIERAPWDNPKVRQAVIWAIDQEGLSQGPFRGVYRPTYTLRPPEMPGGDDDYLRSVNDEERAKQLLAEAGYPGGQGLPPVSIQVTNEEDSVISAEYIQHRLSTVLGMNVSVEVMDSATFLDTIQSGRGHFWQSAVFTLSPDLYDLYNVVQGSLMNNSHWEDPYFADLLERAASEGDPQRRLELYDQAERYITLDQAVIAPLYVTDRPTLIHPRVKNLREDRRSLWIYSWEYIDIVN